MKSLINLPNLHITLERWKFNKEYGVWVSNMGRFKDEYKRPIPPKIYQSSGYVAIHTNCGDKLAHRIVMYTWCPIADREAFTVDHIDHNKRNNAVSNLEWVTQEENIIRAHDDLVTAGMPVVKNASVPNAAGVYKNSSDFSGSIEEAFQWCANHNRLGALSQMTPTNLMNFRRKVDMCCANGKSAYGVRWSYECSFVAVKSLPNKNTNTKPEPAEVPVAAPVEEEKEAEQSASTTLS